MRTPFRCHGVHGPDRHTDHLFRHVSPEQPIPPDEPLRAIRQMVDTALRRRSPPFEQLYSRMGRPSIPPDQLLRA